MSRRTMLLRALPLIFVLTGLVLYATLAGADFGAGFWQLFAGRGERAERIRAHAHRSMGPVWEANHVWLTSRAAPFCWARGHPKKSSLARSGVSGVSPATCRSCSARPTSS